MARPAGLAAPVVVGSVGATVVAVSTLYPGRFFVASHTGGWLVDLSPGTVARVPETAVLAAYFTGLLVLGLAWRSLVRRLRARPGAPVAVVLAVFAAWSLPFLVAAPVASDDAILYAGVGELLARGHDPYEVGLAAGLGDHPAVAAASLTWRDLPSPYGPLWVEVSGAVARVTGGSLVATVLALRLVGVACLVALAAPLVALARRFDADPAVVVGVALCSPIVVVQLVGGLHNESLMLLLLAAGVVAGERAAAEPQARRRALWGLAAAALCAGAVAVKLPAVVGLGLVAWRTGRLSGSGWRRGAWAAAVVAAGAAVVAALSVAFGHGARWIEPALDVPQRVTPLLSPATAVGLTVEHLLLAWEAPATWPLPTVRTAALVVSLAVAAFWLLRSDAVPAPVALGWAFFAVALGSANLWPWYFAWAVVFLAVRGLPAAVEWTTILVNLVVFPLGVGVLDTRSYTGGFVLYRGVAAAVAAVVVTGVVAGGWWWFENGRRRRLRAAPSGG